MIDTTLCLLLKENQILLAMKKRSFGKGKWNGVGGKIDLEKGDKNVLDSIIREAKEEIGVNIINPEKVGLLHFTFPYKPEWDQNVHLFLAKKWEGEPEESEEMMPKWFSLSKIPYSDMWDDDKYWLPHILEGKKLTAHFVFKEGEKIYNKEIKIVENI